MRQLGMLARELRLVPRLVPKDTAVSLAEEIGGFGIDFRLGYEAFTMWLEEVSAFVPAAKGNQDAGLSQMALLFGIIGDCRRMGPIMKAYKKEGGSNTELQRSKSSAAPLGNTGGDVGVQNEVEAYLKEECKMEEIMDIFRFYCAMDKGMPQYSLTIDTFGHFCRASKLMEEKPQDVRTGAVADLYHRTVGDDQRMNFQSFLVGMVEAIRHKFGAADDDLAMITDAINGLVLPYASKRAAAQLHSDSEAFMVPGVMEVLLQEDDFLQRLFAYYSEGTVGSVELPRVLELAEGFEIITDWTGEGDIGTMYELCTTTAPNTKEDKLPGLQFSSFVEFLCRISLHSESVTKPIDQRVQALINRLKGAEMAHTVICSVSTPELVKTADGGSKVGSRKRRSRSDFREIPETEFTEKRRGEDKILKPSSEKENSLPIHKALPQS